MLLKKILKLVPFVLVSLILHGCPQATNTGDGRMNLGLGNSDPALKETVDRVCRNQFGLPKRNCDHNDINDGSLMRGPTPCDDGNCPKPDVDRTSSVPAVDPVDIEGFQEWDARRSSLAAAAGEKSRREENPCFSASEAQARIARGRGVGPKTSRCPHGTKAGYCGRGVYNALVGAGIPAAHIDMENGEDYDNQFNTPARQRQGWKKISCTPSEGNCPAGAVLVFEDSNPEGSGGGAKYGHVEVVTKDASGNVRYCSDYCSSNYGGTVPGNSMSVYVYTGNLN